MRRFFRPAFIAVALVAAPLANRLAAQDSQSPNADSVVAARVRVATDVATSDSAVSSIDLRAVHRLNAAPATARAPISLAASATGMRSAVHARENVGPLAINAAADHANLGQARAMMIVGGAGLVAGAIIGGDAGTIVMVGGALVGLYGLYQYLQ